MAQFLVRRGELWHYQRRVPKAFADVDSRTIARVSTGVRISDDPRGVKAERIARRINEDLERFWKAMFRGGGGDTIAQYEHARRTARAFGVEYLQMEQLIETPAAVAARLQMLAANEKIADGAVAALLGAVPEPSIPLSGLFDEFERLSSASLADLSPDQLRKWRNPKRRALANLISVVGDVPIASLTRSNALDFRNWWQERILAEDLDIGTANKDIGHLNRMFRTIERAHRIGLEPVFSELRIEGETTASRAAFDAAYVQATLLGAEGLAGLNDEARRVVLLIADTGLRLSEAVNLTRETIRLGAKVPHVQVRPLGRRMKTVQSERDIPLVGAALAAMRKQPDGFPRYRDKSAGLSALVNKSLRDRNLLPTEEHSLYSLRHTFEDRLTAVEAPEKLIAALMGHKYSRPKYGAGPSLEQKREWLERIAFTPPLDV